VFSIFYRELRDDESEEGRIRNAPPPVKKIKVKCGFTDFLEKHLLCYTTNIPRKQSGGAE